MAEKNKLPKVVYSAEEEEWLVANAVQYSHIIENKKTDGATKRDKDKAWEDITKQFNIAPPGQERTLKSLREKYGKIKQNLKNRVFYFAKDAKATGGGPPKKKLPALSETMNKLFAMLIPSTYGLSAATGDSDLSPIEKPVPLPEPYAITVNEDSTILIADEMIVFENENSTANNMVEIQNEVATQMMEEAVEDSWERVNPAKLRKPPNPLLTRRRKQKMESELGPSKKVSKLEEERMQHQMKKHAIELEILEIERERYKLERERAQFDRERAMVELQRAKNLLEYDAELQKARMETLNVHTIQSNIPTVAAKKVYF